MRSGPPGVKANPEMDRGRTEPGRRLLAGRAHRSGGWRTASAATCGEAPQAIRAWLAQGGSCLAGAREAERNQRGACRLDLQGFVVSPLDRCRACELPSHLNTFRTRLNRLRIRYVVESAGRLPIPMTLVIVRNRPLAEGSCRTMVIKTGTKDWAVPACYAGAETCGGVMIRGPYPGNGTRSSVHYLDSGGSGRAGFTRAGLGRGWIPFAWIGPGWVQPEGLACRGRGDRDDEDENELAELRRSAHSRFLGGRAQMAAAALAAGAAVGPAGHRVPGRPPASRSTRPCALSRPASLTCTASAKSPANLSQHGAHSSATSTDSL